MKQVILDTNIFLRFLVGDVAEQKKTSTRIFEQIEKGKTKGVVSTLVLNELIWIAEHFYEYDRAVYIPKILDLLALDNLDVLEMSKADCLALLMQFQQSNLDFTDCYLLKIAQQSKTILVSFDKALMKEPQ